MSAIPPVRRKLLGAALRRYREKAGYTMEDVVRVLECDRSKLSRIETGQRGIRLRELRELLAEYGADEGESRALQAIADPRGSRGWWQEYAGVLPESFRDYLILEAAATQVLVYDSQQVPALLQTEDYARAVACADPAVPAAAQDQIVQAVLARQQAILAGEHPEVMVIIGEGALRQQAGGAALMRDQSGRLTAISENSAQVTIQMLPFAAGMHAGIETGPAAVLGFGQAAGLGVVYLASLSGGVFLDGPDDVARYVQTFMRLQASALSPAETSRLLWQLARA
jgi:transcriptional regulator with XRE-family HTH domain